jgi:hypothetical protein
MFFNIALLPERLPTKGCRCYKHAAPNGAKQVR